MGQVISRLGRLACCWLGVGVLVWRMGSEAPVVAAGAAPEESLQYTYSISDWPGPEDIWDWIQQTYQNVAEWWNEALYRHDPCVLSIDPSCIGLRSFHLPTLSETVQEVTDRYVASRWGGVSPEQIKQIYALTDTAERLTALNDLFGPPPAERVEATYEFAISSRQAQLNQFVSYYFGEIEFDVVYAKETGSEARYGRFIRPGGEFEGVIYEKGAIVVREAAFKKGWEEVGVTIFHEWLHGADDELTEEQIRDLETLWREWFNQNSQRPDRLLKWRWPMSNSVDNTIDLSLWRKEKDALKSEWWKWNWEKTWDPLFDKFYKREADIQDLVCPVCGRKALYAFFEVFHVARRASAEEGRPVYVANRYFGCHACKTQVRDFGEVPRWVKEEAIHWVSDNAQADAERDLAQLNLKTSGQARGQSDG